MSEQSLWYYLRANRLSGFYFKRQFPIGPFIADFCCESKKLVVEVDGESHASQREYDERRTEFLVRQGYSVLRFWNNDVMRNIDGVLEKIKMNL
jgi:very-short-patch-repair endonuclease